MTYLTNCQFSFAVVNIQNNDWPMGWVRYEYNYEYSFIKNWYLIWMNSILDMFWFPLFFSLFKPPPPQKINKCKQDFFFWGGGGREVVNEVENPQSWRMYDNIRQAGMQIELSTYMETNSEWVQVLNIADQGWTFMLNFQDMVFNSPLYSYKWLYIDLHWTNHKWFQ